MQKFNQEQLMQYLYGEASPILRLAIVQALKDDGDLKREIKVLQKTKNQLDKLAKENSVAPSQVSVNAILQYAKTSQKGSK